MAAQPPLPPLSPNAQQFVAGMSQLATKFGVQLVVLAIQDPMQPTVQRLVASPGAMEILRSLIAAKFNLVDEGEIRKKIEDEFGSSTSWEA